MVHVATHGLSLELNVVGACAQPYNFKLYESFMGKLSGIFRCKITVVRSSCPSAYAGEVEDPDLLKRFFTNIKTQII